MKVNLFLLLIVVYIQSYIDYRWEQKQLISRVFIKMFLEICHDATICIKHVDELKFYLNLTS